MARPRTDLTGQRFGRLVVVSRSETYRPRQTLWICHCECGNTIETRGWCLLSGSSKSCGCYGRERTKQSNSTHGLSGTPEYRSWSSMLYRCTKTTYEEFSLYGGRGIAVCERWHTFEKFLEDMGKRPSIQYSIDRINNDDGYHCGHCEECQRNGWGANCRWATRSQQNSNRRQYKIKKV